MALSSMTGFARTPVDVEGARFGWELKSVNARGLEVRLRLPPGLDHLEADIRSALRERVVRGSIFVTLARDAASGGTRLVVNEAALAVVVAAARRLAAENGFGTPSADGLLAIPGVLQDGGAAPSDEEAERRDAALRAALGTAIDALIASRREEGARLGAVLEAQLDTIERLVADAVALSATTTDALRARVKDQVALIVGEAGALDADRLHQEAVLAATRADIREEIDRLTSHIASARGLLRGEAVGRRFDFLTQELNREANTLCSKAFDKRLTAIGIELKAVIDQVREQVQNLA